MSAMISVLGRCQFSAENAYSVRYSTFNSPQPSTHSRTAWAPASWPLMRGSPRDFAQRPLPSMIMAMWRGTVLMLADILTTRCHLESIAGRQVAQVANNEVRMTKLEGMTNDGTTNFFLRYWRFELISSFGIRASSFWSSGNRSRCLMRSQNDRLAARGTNAQHGEFCTGQLGNVSD